MDKKEQPTEQARKESFDKSTVQSDPTKTVVEEQGTSMEFTI